MLRKVVTAFPVVLVSLTAVEAKAQYLSPFEPLDETQLEMAVNFVLGNASFELFRQATAVLIDDGNLPLRGNGVNTIDELATVMMFELNDIWLDTAIVNATDSWFLGRQSDIRSSFAPSEYTALVPNQRRDQDIACLMIGKDKEAYADLAETMNLDKSRWSECVEAYPHQVAYWNDQLQAMRGGQSYSDFILTYVGTNDPALSDFATMIEESKVFDMIVRTFEEFDLKGPVHLVAKSCGRPDVYWSKDERQITYCYEHAQYQAALIANHLVQASTSLEDISNDGPKPVKTGKTF